MLGSYNNVAETLYLQKGGSGDISVPCRNLTQDQIDGVRFLFSQYKKEKLGVILNYPSGCGNSVQVAIFISSICEVQEKPVLVLYDSDQEKEAWIARFAKWTAISEDSIDVDTSNVFVKKQIFIKNIADLGKLCRRDWAIVVVKSDNFMNIFRKSVLKADFKIWITAQDLKKDRDLLRSVCTWINPSDQLLQEYFDKKSPQLSKEDTNNEILLKLLLEEILFTRRGLKPFGAQKRKHKPEIQPIMRVSKKNKDATGKKIKRSKKYKEVPSTSTEYIENVTILHDNDDSFESSKTLKKYNDDNIENSFIINVDETDNEDEESKMDVESFIRDNDPLKSDINLSFDISHLDSTSQPSETSSPKAEEVCTEGSLNFSRAVADIIRNENDIPTEICEDSLSFNRKDAPDVEVKDSTGLSQIDLSEPVIQKVFFISSPENRSFGPDFADQDTDGAKTEKESSNGKRNGVADQEKKVSTSEIKETESSFDSRMKELEERALRKFKGSFLDNMF